jgi:hypothetical protein
MLEGMRTNKVRHTVHVPTSPSMERGSSNVYRLSVSTCRRLTAQDAPAEYWKFLDGGKLGVSRRQGTTTSAVAATASTSSQRTASPILKRRSPEFLADTEKALKFAGAHTTFLQQMPHPN